MQPNALSNKDIVSSKILLSKEKRLFVNALLSGFVDIEEGRTVTIADAKKRLGLP